ncbi:hypothetical protein HA466_0184430 [Hirschfeldia incana]|nr:hypothetical protein HA466_0184430 [Hirschfeldia incana]
MSIDGYSPVPSSVFSPVPSSVFSPVPSSVFLSGSVVGILSGAGFEPSSNFSPVPSSAFHSSAAFELDSTAVFGFPPVLRFERSLRAAMEEAAMEEAVERLRQFLLTSANSLGLKDDWIIPSADLLKELAEDGLHKYIKFKCVATSDSPSKVIDGLVFTKAPVHENMPMVVSPANLLLWEGSLDMDKEDKNFVYQTYSLLDQNSVNMVMVESSVSEEYQGYLLDRDITAVEDMRHRLQRYPSIGYSCTSLRCEITSEDLNDPVTVKPLMHLGGCESLTFLLKGSSTAELKLMKRILKTGYNLFRNELLSSNYFLVALPPSKITPWDMDGGQDEVVTIREDEVSSYIAYSLQHVHDESSEILSSVFCQHRDRFHELRSKCNMTEPQYISSLSRCERWDAKGGKSGALFAKSRDTRLIIKEINKAEFESFGNFAPMYFDYMNEAKKTFLAKVYGLYKVRSSY